MAQQLIMSATMIYIVYNFDMCNNDMCNNDMNNDYCITV